LFLVALLGSASPLFAQGEESILYPSWGLALGSYFTASDAKLRFDVTDSRTGRTLGTDIDLEEDLGLKVDDTLIKVRLTHFVGRRHELSLSYYDLKRTGEKSISREIDFGGVVYPAGAGVRAEIDQQNLELAYTYYLVREDRFGLGISGGVVGLRLDATLDASAQVGGARRELNREASATLPIPMIGLQLRALLLPKLVLLGEGRYLPRVNVENYEGTSATATAGLEWQIFPHFRLGGSYDYFSIDAKVDDDRLRGKVKWTVQGGQLYARFVW
ncbi:MAG TPA: hypothetical protein VIJ02_00525, partial [Thermoanaerobaculia bacterium]